MKPTLWKRNLSCGHYRLTNLPFLAGDYTEPEVGEDCYCRQCFEDVTIVSVEEAGQEKTQGLLDTAKAIGFPGYTQ